MGLLDGKAAIVTGSARGIGRRFGSPRQRREILGGMARGTVASIAMSEPQAGSDVANLSCRAEHTAWSTSCG